MPKQGWVLSVIAALLMLILASCGGGSSPGDVIEAYLAAVVAKDEVTSVRLSCLAWEEQARAEGAAFDANEVALRDVSCEAVEVQGDEAIVTCTGSIRFSYEGGVEETLDLEGRFFRTIFEDGEWKMCGYQ
ncbi:MAG: nuclear transport factor 2 family protein [Anaerolineales bacterium]